MINTNITLKIIAIYFCYITSAFSNPYSYFKIHHELNDFEDKTTGVAFTIKHKTHNAETGISLNKISSDQPLENSNRYTIYPVYIFSNIHMNTPITPFLELGIDMGDLLFDKVDEGETFDTDIYYSAGIKIYFSKQFYLTIYAKTYELYFNEINDITIQNTTIDMKGASMAFYF